MIKKGILSQLKNILNTPPTFKIFIFFPFELASEDVMGSQTQELITKLTYQLITEVVLRQLLVTTPHGRWYETTAYFSVARERNLRFWQVSARKTRRPQNVVRFMGFHKSRFCPLFSTRDRPKGRPKGARPRPSRPPPPLSAPTIAIAAAVVVVCRKGEEEAIFLSSSPAQPKARSDRK